MDIALAIENLLFAAEYSGVTVDNTQQQYDALVWRDTRRSKPSWEELEKAWGEYEVEQKNSSRIAEIDAELEKLDRDALRPMCTISAWPQHSDVDYEKEMALMQAIEGMKIDLREERRALTGGGEDAPDVAEASDADPVDTAAFLLNSTGSTYHLWECALAKTGKKMTLTEIADKYPSAAPCATCCPPAFTKGA